MDIPYLAEKLVMIFSKHIKTITCFSLACLLIGLSSITAHAESDSRAALSKLIAAPDKEAEASALDELSLLGDPIIEEVVSAWRVGEITHSESTGVVYWKLGLNSYQNLTTGAAVTPAEDHKKMRPSRKLRKELSKIVDLLELKSPDHKKRAQAAKKLGSSQKPEYVSVLQELAAKQETEDLQQAFKEAIAISLLANGTQQERIDSITLLGDNNILSAKGFIEDALKEAVADGTSSAALVDAAKVALDQLARHQSFIDITGTLVRGLSTGSVLLLVSYGLAITFGQMGVINMAHGEFIAIGGYTVYLVQTFILETYGMNSAMYDWYFIIAIPIAFLVSAIAGAILEKGLIQFLYSRPLESLLATWAVSMVMQQALRLHFGAANVSVSSPEWLSGSANFGGVLLSYNRLSLILFAILVVIVTRLLLSKTNWGLHVRATMQNRQMASSLGVPSSRVNMLTFAFGSGLAGLAGAFISQIGNVGPSMGQTYIVDSFMVVVVGGVGNLLGAAISSLGIGMIDQGLQPLLGPVMGKITVLFMIIGFLQFKPGGIFPARSRSLDD